MKKILFLLLLNILFFNFSYADKYWSDEKIAPTNIDEGESFIMKKYLDITPSEDRFNYSYIHGVWYSHSIGFVGIYEEEYKSNKFKMVLIKAPMGFGASKFAEYNDEYSGYAREIYYRRWIQLEGTIIASIEIDGITSFNSKHKINIRNSEAKEDDTFIDTNISTNLEIKSDDYFQVLIPLKDGSGSNKINFARYSSELKKIIRNIDSSKKITDFEIETREDSSFIYFDTKVDNEIIKDKFIDVNQYGDITVGQIYRGLKLQHINGIKSITCINKGSPKGIPGLMYYMESNNESEEGIYEEIKRNCDTSKIKYSTFRNYENRTNYYLISFFTFATLFLGFIKLKRRKELLSHNRNNKNKFKTYSELKQYQQKIEDKESLKQAAKDEKERKIEEAKLEREAKAEEVRIKAEERRLEKEEKRKEKLEYKEVENDYDDSLMDKVKKLKRLYKSGTLSKAEFEKAKNKLLK